MEIFYGDGDMDICKEIELMKFNRMLSDAQKRAQAEKKAKGNKWKTYTGHLQITAYHQKCC